MDERGWWIDASTVRPELARRRRVSITACAWKESRPLVGSSMKMIGGLLISSIPMVTRRRSPPDSPLTLAEPTKVSAHLTRLSSAIVDCTRASLSAGELLSGRRSLAVNMNVSRTVESAKSASCCSTYAESCAMSCSLRSCPLTRSLPKSFAFFICGTRHASTLSSDVLPEPLGPMIAITCRGSTLPLTPSSTSFCAFFLRASPTT